MAPETATLSHAGSSSLDDYRRAALPLPQQFRRWHLYGAGLENVGDPQNHAPETLDLPEPGPDQILVRHDACGICFSDVKIITLGGEHPRLQGRDLKREPVVMGHEVALTVVKAGANHENNFQPGQRFIVQADVFYHGVNLAYGYALPGGMAQFGIVGPEVLAGDEGCYLLPIEDKTGYAEAALVEPWACVEAAYHWAHHDPPKPDGNQLTVYRETARVELTPGEQETIWQGNGPAPAAENGYDQIEFVGTPRPETFEAACAHLTKGSFVVLRLDQPFSAPVKVDVGRIHYDGHRYIGVPKGPLKQVPGTTNPFKANLRSELKAGGTVWFIGAAGPMGQMHVQRALQRPEPPAKIVGTDRDPARLQSLRDRFGKLAAEKNVELVLFNPEDPGAPRIEELAPAGFDDIVVMVPSVALIEQAFPLLAPGGVLNVFAGVARGTMATLDMTDIATKNVRIVGTTGSTIEDMKRTRDVMEQGALDTGASLAAIGGLNAFRDGLDAVKNGTFPGKTVIFPQIEGLPLTALADLETVRPNVFAKLRDGRFWTAEAEAELLREAL